MPERSIGTVSKTVVHLVGTEGSNPSLSAKYPNSLLVGGESSLFVLPESLPSLDIRCQSYEPAKSEEVETARAEAIRSSAGGQMTRYAEVFLAGICAKHLTDQLALAGFVFMRRLD